MKQLIRNSFLSIKWRFGSLAAYCFFIFSLVMVLLLSVVSAPARAEVLPVSCITSAQFAVGYGAEGVGVGDFNGDGRPDLAVPNNDIGTVAVMLSNGDGTFSPVLGGNFPPSEVNRCYGVSVGDFNGDGNPDLALPNLSLSAVSVLLGLGDGTFDTVVNYVIDFDPRDICVGDFNSDGRPDLAVIGCSGFGAVEILPGNGDGTFNPSINFFRPGTDGRDGAVGDFNSDGKLDLAVANGSGVFVVLDVDNAVYQRLAVYPAGYALGIAAGDFNQDGKIDLAAADPINNQVGILLGIGDGSFDAAVYYMAGTNPVHIVAADFNADGNADLAVANQNSSNVSILLGMGDGTFDTAIDYAAGGGDAIFDVATGDFNKDGKLDMAVIRGMPSFFCNIDILMNTTQIVTTLSLNNPIPDLKTGGSVFDLNSLSPTAQNQLGQPANITDMPVTWACSGTTGRVINTHYLEPLSIGEGGTVTVTIDGVTSNALAFNVIPNADLDSLSLSTGDIGFSPSITSYPQTVNAGMGSVTLTASPDDPQATVIVNGSPLPAGDSRAMDLNYGVNSIEIVVTAQDASTKTYIIDITREYPLITWDTGSLEASNVNTTGMTLTWPAALSDAGISDYQVYRNGILVTTVNRTVHSYNAVGLNAGTIYTFSVYALDSGENLSNVLTLTTSTLSIPHSGGRNSSPSPSQSAHSDTGSALVYPSVGGTVSLGNDVLLNIPVNALPGRENAEVSIQQVDASPAVPSGFKLMSAVYELSVNSQNHYSFAQPVTLIFSFDASRLEPGETPAVHYYDETRGQWVNIGGTISGNTISVSLNHFTQYAVMTETMIQPGYDPILGFTDTRGHWAEAKISKLIGLGVISGYPNGTFKPDNSVTRAEFASMLVKAFKLEEKDGIFFNDTAGHWARDFISTAASWNIVSGYDNTHFGPDDFLTREQMAVMLVKAAKLNLASGEMVFTDTKDISAWARDSVAVAVNNGIIAGYPDSAFKPKGNATRAEAVTAIVNAQHDKQ